MSETIHDIDEIKRVLRGLGVPVNGKWEESEERKVESPLLERQRSMLEKAKGLLEHQLEQDQRTVAKLHADVARLKHGGGS